MTEDTRGVHEHVLSHLGPPEAVAVLDLGCGRGEHLRMLARTMQPDARLVGLDSSQKVLEEARSEVGADARFLFLQHDLNERLPFEEGEFDWVLSVNTLEAIRAKPQFAREAHRVLRAGGRLVCAHYDWESQLFDGSDKAVVRRVVQAFADWKQAWMATSDGWMGRRLWKTFQESGLFEGYVDAHTHTSTSYEPGCYGWEQSRAFQSLVKRDMITQSDYDDFISGLEDLAAHDRFFYAITMFTYIGVKVA